MESLSKTTKDDDEDALDKFASLRIILSLFSTWRFFRADLHGDVVSICCQPVKLLFSRSVRANKFA